ncbi:hypothetical protein NLI96_g10422 [Meripilus lineatus]|uniref:GH16 domain-containing protein n=1 Tax=Meripilus lineatus TaxID=2056292 RepID=A0AAD5UTQ1_9APHY|nr:hypothetical protein NLI96_g10422 [Physisporinus lineatus]
MFSSLKSLVLASLATSALATTYSLTDNHVGKDFLSTFTHQAIADPTHGRVNYVDQATALAQNLTFASGNTLIMRADSRTTLSASGPGRNSVRIRSVKTYTTHAVVFDIRHMPQGCATWPAAWETLESNWPNSGEVDITGTSTSLNCDANVNGNTGCGVQAPTTNSYGPSFNSNGGGWYAMERTSTFIKVWFWPRNSGSVPSGVKNGGSSVDTANWGTPTAFFPNTNCDINSHFGPNNIIINLTLCGDWAGIPSLYNGAGCPGDCVSYVNNNPSAFANAYWDIAAVRVYQ